MANSREFDFKQMAMARLASIDASSAGSSKGSLERNFNLVKSTEEIPNIQSVGRFRNVIEQSRQTIQSINQSTEFGDNPKQVANHKLKVA